MIFLFLLTSKHSPLCTLWNRRTTPKWALAFGTGLSLSLSKKKEEEKKEEEEE